MKKKLSKLLIMALCVGMLPVPEGKAASNPKVTKSMNLTVGQSKTVKVKGSRIKKKAFASSNKKVATVTQKGKVSAKKSGNCKITVKVTYKKSNKAKKCTTKKYTCKVFVKDKTVSTPTSAPDTATANPSNPPALNMPESSVQPVATSESSVEPAGTSEPGETPDINVKKSENDVKVLTELIKHQKELGARVSEDLDSKEYVWEKASENDTETRLVKVDWYYGGLKEDVSFEGLPELKCLYIGSSELTSLDLSKNTLLETLNCWECSELTSLDLSGNTLLETLNCSYCPKLTSMNLSKNTLLKRLNLSNSDLVDSDTCYCSLTSLDMSKNTLLTSLSCVGNPLTSLDVSKNTLLTYLLCDEDCNVTGYNGTIQHPVPPLPAPSSPTQAPSTPEPMPAPTAIPDIPIDTGTSDLDAPTE